MAEGTILWFNRDKNLGVISTETGERLDVEGTDFAEGERPLRRRTGEAVTFRIVDENGTAKPVDVSFVPVVVPRRARMRHGRYR